MFVDSKPSLLAAFEFKLFVFFAVLIVLFLFFVVDCAIDSSLLGSDESFIPSTED
jgi:hypothetical protein